MSTSSIAIPKLSEVPAAWRRLLDLCREINFGHVDALEIVDGHPIRFGRTVKVMVPGRPNGPAPTQHERLPIHTKWAEFIADAKARGRVSVLRLDLDQGLPIKAEFVAPGGELA